MKVIREEMKKGPLKGIMFLENGINTDEQIRITDLANEVRLNTAKTKKLTKDDIMILNNYIEITTCETNYCQIDISDNMAFIISNILNKEETEWLMQYTFYKDNNIIFNSLNLKEILDYIYDGKKIIDILVNNEITNIGFSQK